MSKNDFPKKVFVKKNQYFLVTEKKIKVMRNFKVLNFVTLIFF
jgi:hypothetical protein